MSTGFAVDASIGRSAAIAARVSSERAGSSRPAASQASAQRMPRPPAFVSTATRRPFGARLAREQGGDVEELDQRVGAEHARLAEDGVDGGVRSGEGCRVRAGRLAARPRAAALHREDRLLACESAGDPGELARVAERLEVHQDEVGAGVVLPPLEQVVGRDVRLVADRDEGRDADASFLGPFEQRQPERARLRREADAAGGECARGEGRVHGHGRRRDAEAVGADEARAVRPHECEQLLLARTTLHSGLGESGGDHAERARAAPKRRLGGVEDAVAGQADHAEIDRVRDVLDRGVGAHAGDRGARPVDRICSTGEAAGQNVAEELSADRAALRRCADHGHGARLEERSQRGGDRHVVALVHSSHVALGWSDREPHLDDASLESTADA